VPVPEPERVSLDELVRVALAGPVSLDEPEPVSERVPVDVPVSLVPVRVRLAVAGGRGVRG
jgi:hypothetical protein